jgi:hypothetical protein
LKSSEIFRFLLKLSFLIINFHCFKCSIAAQLFSSQHFQAGLHKTERLRETVWFSGGRDESVAGFGSV